MEDGIQTIPLTEYKTESIAPAALSEAEGTLLWRHYDREQGVVQVAFPSPRTGGQWTITARGWVGHIPLTPTLAFHLKPRTPVHNLFQMLAHVYDLRRFRFLDGLVQSDSLPDFYEGLAELLARRVLARARQGFHRAYLVREESLPYVRGQLQLRRPSPSANRLSCRFEEQTTDIPDNQILAWTLRRLALGAIYSEGTQALVRRAYRTIRSEATTMPVAAGDCDARRYSRLNEDYRALHALCRFFLQQSTPGHRLGADAMVPFLVNMPSLFERFVASWLSTNLCHPWRLSVQENVVAADSISFALDLVLYDGAGRPYMVLDTKYKDGKRVSTAEISQVVTYAELLGCHEAVLVYPEKPAQALDTRIGDIRVRALPFSLAGNLDREGHRFLEQLLS